MVSVTKVHYWRNTKRWGCTVGQKRTPEYPLDVVYRKCLFRPFRAHFGSNLRRFPFALVYMVHFFGESVRMRVTASEPFGGHFRPHSGIQARYRRMVGAESKYVETVLTSLGPPSM